MSLQQGLDLSDFISKTNKIIARLPEPAEKALRTAAHQLKIDADQIEPKTPHLHGDLRNETEIRTINPFIVMVIYLAPYAARWHEADGNIDPITGRPVNWSEPGVGPKFLMIKMFLYAAKYVKIMAEVFKRWFN